MGAIKASPGPKRISRVFRDFFERPALGPDYRSASRAWRLQNGQVCVSRARNHPLWLQKQLPENARIEFDAVAQSTEGDIKVEVWGDGSSAATDVSYDDATSYLVIYGGWKNSQHALARLDEHGEDRQAVEVVANGAINARAVRPHHDYHFKIERADGRTVRWFVDDIEVTSFEDPSPLQGRGHEYFAFNNWTAPVCFDNLTITPL